MFIRFCYFCDWTRWASRQEPERVWATCSLWVWIYGNPNFWHPNFQESKFPAIHKSGKLKSWNSKIMVNHPIARENIINYVLILSHSLWGCHDHLPTNVIHQKNSNPLVIAGFKGFHDLLNHIKIKGGVKCHTNRESPCTITRPKFYVIGISNYYFFVIVPAIVITITWSII